MRSLRFVLAALILSACESATPLTPAPVDGGADANPGTGLDAFADDTMMPSDDAVPFEATPPIDAGPDSTDVAIPDAPDVPPIMIPTQTATQLFQATGNRDLDILFMIDNSPSMMPLQTKLEASFPAFVNALSGSPVGLPNLHLAVVSSDLGSGPTAPVTQCRVGGDQGQFQSSPRLPSCTTGLAPDQHFLASVNGAKNFTGDLSKAFTCIAQLGDQGCGFEHQLASVLRALEPGPNLPATNQGFLRPSAYLGIVLLTNEDDCSAPPDADLFSTTSQLVSDPLGPLASYRCNEFGHLCGGQKPPRTAAVLTDCTSAEDGRLLKVADMIARTRALKADPSQILVAAIAAPTTPYEVILQPGTTSSGVMENQPAIKHSCTTADGTYGDPAIRIKQWVDAFKGMFVSICNDTFAPALNQIAGALSAPMGGPQCFAGALFDTDPNTTGVQPSCTVTDLIPNGQATIETNVPSCATSNGATPCWTAPADQTACADAAGAKTLITVKRDVAAPNGSTTRVTCAVCTPDDHSAGCRP